MPGPSDRGFCFWSEECFLMKPKFMLRRGTAAMAAWLFGGRNTFLEVDPAGGMVGAAGMSTWNRPYSITRSFSFAMIGFLNLNVAVMVKGATAMVRMGKT